MEEDSHSIAPEALLANEGFVRRVAQGLVRGGEVDDVVQETFLAALCAPPRRSEALLAWLASTARNVAVKLRRGEARRSEREGRAARADRSEAADALVLRLEVQRRVVEAVLDLPEPYRYTVLLRFYEGLGPSAIAARTAVPVNTVAARLRRAQERLREKLAALPFAERRRLARGLAPLAGVPPPRTGMPALAPAPLAVAAALSVVTAGAWIALRSADSARPGARPANAVTKASPEVASVRVDELQPAAPGAPELAATVEDEAPEPRREAMELAAVPEPLATGRLRVEAVDALSGAELGNLHARLASDRRFATLDGGPRLDAVLTPGTWELVVGRPGYEPAWSGGIEIRANAETDLGELALAPGAGTIEGRVLAAHADGEVRARVELLGRGRHPCAACAETTVDEDGTSHTSDPFERETPCAVCGFARDVSAIEVLPGERFAFEHLASGSYAVRVGLAGSQGSGRSQLVELPRGGYRSLELGLESTRTLELELVDPAGLPFEGRWMQDGEQRSENVDFRLRREGQVVGESRFSSSAHSVYAQLVGQFEIDSPSTHVLASQVTGRDFLGEGARQMTWRREFEARILLDARALLRRRGAQRVAPRPIDRARAAEDSLWPVSEPPEFESAKLTFDWLGDGRYRVGPLVLDGVDLQASCGPFQSAWSALDAAPDEHGRLRIVLAPLQQVSASELGNFIEEALGLSAELAERDESSAR